MNFNELRHAIRRLTKRPGITLMAIAVLALGIGANTSIFTLVNAVLLRPLPYVDSSRLVSLGETLKNNTTDEVTLTPDFLEWRQENTVFTTIAAFNISSRTLSGGAEPLQVAAAKASAELLPILQVQPVLGRNFRNDEDQPGHDAVALISNRLWRDEFSNNPDILGKAIHVDDRIFTIIGVLPSGFAFPAIEEIEVVTPLAKNEQVELKRADGVTIVNNVIARLKPGVTLGQARSEMQLIQSRLSPPSFLRTASITVNVKPLSERFVQSERDGLLIIFGSAGFLLILGCASLASLLLSQAADRQREVAIRAALGATRWRLVQLGIAETGILAACGCLLAIALTFEIRTVLLRFSRSAVPGLKLTIDPRVLGFAVFCGILSAIGCGVIPMLFAWGKNVAESLVSSGQTFTAARGRQRVMRLLVSSQFAIAVLLITGAGLLLQSFWKVRYRDLGFRSEHVITAQLHLSKKRYPTVAQQAAFGEQFLQTVQNMPGIETAALGQLPPGEGHATNGFAIEGRLLAPSGHRPVARQYSVTSGYFHLLGVPILRGRALLPTDTAASEPVAIVNQAFAQQNFPNGDAVGGRIRAEPAEPWQRIIGIVADIKTAGLPKAPEPTFYRAFSQFGGSDDVGLLVSTPLQVSFVAPELRRELSQADPEQALVGLESLDERLSDSVAKPQEAAILLGAFAVLALLIARSASMEPCHSWCAAGFARWVFDYRSGRTLGISC